MMELSLKLKSIKKKHKKKRKVIESTLAPLIKPGSIDGVSNWMRMQKVFGPISDATKRPSEDKSRVLGIKQNSKDYKPAFSHKENIRSCDVKYQKPQAVKSEKATIYKNSAKGSDVTKNSNKAASSVSSEHKKSDRKNNETESFTFNFNEGINGDAIEDAQSSEPHRDSDKKLTKAIAMDCEMVGTGPTGDDSIIARVSIVNSLGDCLYDEFVKPKEKVTDYRTRISGVRPSDLKNAKDLLEVQRDVLRIMEGRILVGHSIKHDLDVLFISHPRHQIRDTAYYKPFRDLCGGRTPSLKKLTSIILGCEIQSGEHSSVEDAQAAMLLYLRQRHEWEYHVKSQRKRKPKLNNNQTES